MITQSFLKYPFSEQMSQVANTGFCIMDEWLPMLQVPDLRPLLIFHPAFRNGIGSYLRTSCTIKPGKNMADMQSSCLNAHAQSLGNLVIGASRRSITWARAPRGSSMTMRW